MGTDKAKSWDRTVGVDYLGWQLSSDMGDQVVVMIELGVWTEL